MTVHAFPSFRSIFLHTSFLALEFLRVGEQFWLRSIFPHSTRERHPDTPIDKQEGHAADVEDGEVQSVRRLLRGKF